jgi:hypothetical protein
LESLVVSKEGSGAVEDGIDDDVADDDGEIRAESSNCVDDVEESEESMCDETDIPDDPTFPVFAEACGQVAAVPDVSDTCIFVIHP